MSNDLARTTSQGLNPYYAKVMGFVGVNGDFMESPAANQFQLLINVGETNGIKLGARVVIFALGPKLTDPDTGEPLGHFEIVRGGGNIISVQSRMAIVASSRIVAERFLKPVAPIANVMGIAPEQGVRDVPAAFKSPAVGDLVRFV